MIRFTSWIKNKTLLPAEGKTADLVKGFLITLFCCVALLLCMKPFLYIAIQIMRFMIFSFLWICDITMNHGRGAADLNPFLKLAEWDFISFML